MPGPHDRPTRLLVADPSFLTVQGLVRILETAGMSVPATASHADALGRKARHHPVDVVIADLRLPDHEESSGLEAILWLRRVQPRAGVVALSDRPEPQLVSDLAYCRVPRVALLAKEQVTDAGAVIDVVRRVSTPAPAAAPAGPHTGLAALTPSERIVLALMAKGRSDAGIAYLISATLPAVEGLAASVFRKLGLPPAAERHRRVQAVRLYLGRESPG